MGADIALFPEMWSNGYRIYDRPTAEWQAEAIDVDSEFVSSFGRLAKELGMAIIMITHDLGIVAEICDEVSVVYGGRVVEHGTLHDVFEGTKHPYTEGLFNSLPNVNNRTAMLKPIPGLMLDPTETPAGCPFAPRCAYAVEKCFASKPPKITFSETHYTECHRYEEADFRLNGRDSHD